MFLFVYFVRLGCVFALNCDTSQSLVTTPPVITQISVGPLGGCFIGPQICKQREEIIAAGKKFMYIFKHFPINI